MEFLHPPALRPGDSVGIVAPSAPMLVPTGYDRGVKRIKDLGYRIIEGKSVHAQYRYMAGNDKLRTKDIMEMFENENVRAIICLIGGSTANRLLLKLDYERIARNPKIFTGLSDITNLHLAFLSRSSLISLHGIDLTFGFGGEVGDPAIEYSIELFQRVATDPKPLNDVPAFSKWETWRPGIAEGRLVGGYLPALSLISASRFWPRIDDGIILFWEAIDLEIHDIDRYLHAIRVAGVLDQVKGMLVGHLIDCAEREFKGMEPTVRELVVEIADELNIPVLAGVDFGHGDSNLPLPLGLKVRMNANEPALSFIEGYVV